MCVAALCECEFRCLQRLEVSNLPETRVIRGVSHVGAGNQIQVLRRAVVTLTTAEQSISLVPPNASSKELNYSILFACFAMVLAFETGSVYALKFKSRRQYTYTYTYVCIYVCIYR